MIRLGRWPLRIFMSESWEIGSNLWARGGWVWDHLLMRCEGESFVELWRWWIGELWHWWVIGFEMTCWCVVRERASLSYGTDETMSYGTNEWLGLELMPYCYFLRRVENERWGKSDEKKRKERSILSHQCRTHGFLSIFSSSIGKHCLLLKNRSQVISKSIV